MDITEVPASRLITETHNAGIAALALDSILRPAGARFHYTEVINGASRSGRVLRQKSGRDTVAISPRTGEDLVPDLKDLLSQARFDPPQNTEGRQKGWSIREAIIDEFPVAIIWCVWVP